MGKLMKATMNLYSDSSFTTLAASIPNIIIGVAVGNTSQLSIVNIQNNYTFFIDKLSDSYVFLGSTAVKLPTQPVPTNKYPNLWFPQATLIENSAYQSGRYVEFLFSNGIKYRNTMPLGFTGGSSVEVLDANNSILARVAPTSALTNLFITRFSNNTESRYLFAALVVSALNADGTVPTSATAATYFTTDAITPTDKYGGVDRLTSNEFNVVRTLINAVPAIPTDPYSEIPQSGPSEPSGTYDFTSSDNIGVPQLPALSAVNTGFISLWAPTEEQMLKLSSFMWNANPLTIEFWKKIVADPMQLIYGLNIIPLDLGAMGMIDGAGNVVVGLISTGITMNHLSGQWVELDCGKITLDETWSAYLDYDPYTKLEIYLPYCGTHPLKVDDFMPGDVKLKYHIDLLSGACVAILTSTKSNKHGDTLNSVVYEFMGNCAAQIPVTASQYADAVRSVIQLAASVGAMIAGAAGAGAAAAASESAALPASTGLSISSGTHAAAAMVENVMGIKPNIERSGAIGATGGLLSVQVPYLILTRPRQAHPEDQNAYTGYPSFITETLNDLEGWTQVQAIHLENIPCTADEMTEIDGLLKSGVIF